MKKIIPVIFCLFALTVVAMAATVEVPEIDKHAEFGLLCEDCHIEGENVAAPNDVCIDCHGSYYDGLADLTAQYHNNPHMPHLDDFPCLECHKMHEESYNVCAECHDVTFTVP